jgi:high affinity Mn2+ porin
MGAALLYAGGAIAEDWNGPYVGGFASYETATRKLTVPTSFAPREEPRVNGWGAGAIAGYNWQVNPAFLLGVEVDQTWSYVEPRMTYLSRSSTQAIHIYDAFNYLGSLRGRAGFTYGPLLLYGTGGVAWMHGASRLNMTDGPAPNWGPSIANDYADAWHLGWSAGAGLEWKASAALTARAEWLRYDFGTQPYYYQGVSINTVGGGVVEAFRSALITQF